MGHQMPEQTVQDIGEIKGMLQGIVRMIDTQNTSINRRIDDMHASNTQRLDDLTRAIHGRLDSHAADLARVERTADKALELATRNEESLAGISRHATKTGTLTGASAGTLVPIAIEICKQLLRGP